MSQASVSPAPPAPPAPPLPPLPPLPTVAPTAQGAGGAEVVTLPAGPVTGIPQTREQITVLRAQRSELSKQLNSAQDRREELANWLNENQGSPEAVRAGVEQRIITLDKRIVQLEEDIAETGRRLSSAPVGLARTSSESREVRDGFNAIDVERVTIIGMVFIGTPLAIAAASYIWRRGSRPPAAKGISPEAMQRFDQLDRSMEAIAIEIERVAEGQRFVTRLMSERQAMPELGAGQRVPDAFGQPAREKQPVPLRREDA